MDDEYLITNQLGGYLSSTFHKGNTRKYHGLLVVSNENLERFLILSQLEEKVHLQGEDIFFSTATFAPGVTTTKGSTYLTSYSRHSSTICFEYSLPGDISILKEVSLAQEANSVSVRYKIVTPTRLHLNIGPLITKRNIHNLKHYESPETFKASSYLNNARISLGSYEELTMKVMSFDPKKLLNISYSVKNTGHVYKNFYYEEEALRDYESTEDLIKPLEMSFAIESGETYVTIQFNYLNAYSNLPRKASNNLKLVYNLDYKKKEAKHTPLLEFKDFLGEHYREFLVDTPYRKSIVAGYHWFADWGRDTFISFPGLLLATGEYSFAKDVLDYWIKYIRDGLIPNSLTNKAYNTIDASLWFMISVYHYYQHTGDKASLKKWFPAIRNLLVELINGSGFSIAVDGNGFLVWTDPRFNLTWMDSEVDGVSATGRLGACVEVEMLWYNCLKIFEFMIKELNEKDQHTEITGLAKLVFQKFNKLFWNPATDYAFDFINGDKADPSIRPNVLLGLSLPYRLFDKRKTEKILYRAFEDLYTEVGLMTLNKIDLKYNGFYTGSQKKRDAAYHNGTVWPYLLGFYLKALLASYPGDSKKMQDVKELLIIFWNQIKEKNLTYLPEVFAANDLHPDGCLSQAWNYALFLEVYSMLNS